MSPKQNVHKRAFCFGIFFKTRLSARNVLHSFARDSAGVIVRPRNLGALPEPLSVSLRAHGSRPGMRHASLAASRI